MHSIYLSKIIWLLIDPLNLFFALGAASCVFLWIRPLYKTGRIGFTVFWSLVLLTVIFPVDEYVLGPLEQRFPALHSYPEKVNGIIVLGGGIDIDSTVYNEQLSVNDAGERLLALITLASAYPTAKIVYAGGNGNIVRNNQKEADLVKKFLSSLGLGSREVFFENESRNTFENAAFTKKIADPKPGEVWMLITSAFHMPRAVGVFRHHGWDVLPYPVDYRSSGPKEVFGIGSFVEKWRRLSAGLREWTGLVYYRMMTYTEDLLPSQSWHEKPK